MDLQAAKQLLAEDAAREGSENIAVRYAASKRLEEAGDYAGACEVLGSRWRGAGVRPDLRGLRKREEALLLLRAGMLSHRISLTEARAGAQDEAKDLLSEAARLFGAEGDCAHEAEALVGVGLCCLRQTALDEARIVLDTALRRAGEAHDAKTAALVTLALVEWTAGRDDEALRILLGCEGLVSRHGSHRLRASYHCALALARRRFGDLDSALVEYAATSYHLEQAGDIREWAALENNVGNLLSDAGRYDEAHEHYDRSWRLFTQLKDYVSAGRVDDSRAQALLAEKRFADAARFARRGVEALDGSDDKAPYVEGLVTLGRALARQGQGAASWQAFETACEVAHNFISQAAADEVTEVMMDELGPLLRDALGLSYIEAYQRFQQALIKRALEETNWNITQAAFKLGLKQQGLSQLLKKTHKAIWDERPPN